MFNGNTPVKRVFLLKKGSELPIQQGKRAIELPANAYRKVR